MTSRMPIDDWADQCRAGQLSRRDFGQRLLNITGSVLVTLDIMRRLGVPAEAHEIGDPPPRPPRKEPEEILYCSFCNKDQNQVTKLIAGRKAFICGECVAVCNDIIEDDNRFATEHILYRK